MMTKVFNAIVLWDTLPNEMKHASHSGLSIGTVTAFLHKAKVEEYLVAKILSSVVFDVYVTLVTSAVLSNCFNGCDTCIHFF